MKISTIMVCRNAERTLGGAVESFLIQDHPDKELVVVDGASDDGTLALLDSFDSPEISVVSEADKGIYDAMNKGLGRFSGDAFGFLNADDRYHDETALSRIASALGDADMVSGHLHFVSDHDGSPPARIWRASQFKPGAFQRGWAPAHPVTYATRQVFDKVGLFDPTYASAGDYDWLLRALEIERVSYVTIDSTLVDMALGGVSTRGLGANIQNARETSKARRTRLGAGPVDLAMLYGPLRKLDQVLMARTGSVR